MSEPRTYTGVGSRQTPPKFLEAFERIAAELKGEGWWLRSGNADGADKAFGKGAGRNATVYLPWKGFGGPCEGIKVRDGGEWKENFALMVEWGMLSETDREPLKMLFGRDFAQVLGRQRSGDVRSEFVICWTENGMPKGGTGIAIKVANKFNIPVLNVGKREYGDLSIAGLVNVALQWVDEVTVPSE